MRNTFYILFIFFCFSSCINKKTTKSVAKISHFNLNKNLIDFSKKMENEDTLIIKVDLSACMGRQYEKNVIIKRNDSLFIEVDIKQEPYYEFHITELKPKNYTFHKSDSLNFENLFMYLKNGNYKYERNQYSKPTFEITYKKDTVYFDTKGLINLFEIGEYYKNIQNRIYPKYRIYYDSLYNKFSEQIIDEEILETQLVN